MSFKEVHVANTSDLRDGEMKAVSIDKTRVLLARVDGRFHAVSAKCSHYGGPLAEGVLCGAHVMCPWHHAVFDVTNGGLVEPPALDALACYDVRVEGERVLVSVREEAEEQHPPAMAQPDQAADPRQFVIIGGGAAGYAAAQTLREEGFCGHVVMITREDRAPYDRPNLSKDYLHGHADPEWMPLRSGEFFSEHGIKLISNREVTRVDARTKTITFAGGETMDYDALLVATGGAPAQLKIPGSELKNVFVLRSFAEADAIIETAQRAQRVVVVGANFIGMEAAFSLRRRGLDVTVVAPSQEPFEKALGVEIGALFRGLHEKRGVSFKLGSTVSRFEGNDRIEAVVLDTGERIETDMVVLGVGVRPVTHFLDGVELQQDGGVVVDSRLRATDGVYAAGDIASFIYPPTGERVRIEHWRTALQQGRVAARNMLGRDVPFTGIPFFWTEQFGVRLNYVGRASSWDEIIFRGDVAAQKFLAFYVKDNRVLAAAGVNRDRELAEVEELIRLGHLPAPAQLKTDDVNLLEMLRSPVV